MQTFHGVVIGKPYRSYVAIGDSLSEGLGDFTFQADRYHNGWTDRLAGILAREASDSNYEFHYANLALRGSKLSKIMTEQLPAALNLQPDLVTVMAGSNDLMSKPQSLPKLRELLRDGIEQLLAAGCDVVVANTINPLHLRVFKPLRHKAELFSTLIETVADEFDLPVLDVYGIRDFEQLVFWADDMVHFSGHGHIAIANQAAELLNLNYRFPQPDISQLAPVSRGLIETVRWVGRDVIPFFDRRLKGKTSGDGMLPKHLQLTPYAPKDQHPTWELVSA
ncbi:SGNH/GDSL hydrolase family protein [Aquiluna borgnonia]|uniref:SGNH/GDSL hydrolase family protein n=1 Tax=Aquiluna borgnonia TaxID=2499157 RepID=A0A7D4UL60_9MICO|nr:SGNH/GDSL hydrolase family protein [Aquiluna borgnonia]QKJ24738.1 SGNH/GDSL hydrolase family protein [Aquiluna borgnonia]